MSSALSLLGWTFLPNLVTGWVQFIYYGIAIRAGDLKPRPGTPRYAEHRRRIHLLVVTLYLLYTIYEADYEIRRAGSFYADLGVPLTATEREVKSRFRRLAAVHHPDKQQQSANGGGDVDVNAYFVHLKLAADTLTDPARRFAYERFGPAAATEWRRCVTVRDFVVRGAQAMLPYYAAAAATMYGLGLLGYLDWGRSERWLVLLALLCFEAHTVTRPHMPWVLDAVVNPALALLSSGAAYLPFQAIALARRLGVTIYIAFSQLGPLLAKPSDGLAAGASKADSSSSDAALRQGLERLEVAARSLDADAERLLHLEMAPFAGDKATLASVKAKLTEWLVQNTIRVDPMVKDAMGNSLRRRRVDAPPGARGNR